jgi:4-amino-4-deoxy-L-arabinose transferase-like glycosyltransferase
MSKKTEWLLLAVICLVGGTLLFANLDLYDIWGDETFTFPKGSNIHEVIAYTKMVAITVHPPLYNIIQFTYSQLFSDMDTVKNRFFYAIFGFLNLIMVYILGKNLFDKKVALFATFLCATSPFLVMYSRMLRYYPMNTFFILLTIWLFLRLKEKGGWLRWLLFTLAGTALAYGNYLGIIVLFVLFLSVFSNPKYAREHWGRWVLSGIVIFLLYLPWMPVVTDQIGREYNPYPELAYQAEKESPRVAQRGFGIRGVAVNSIMKVGYLGYVFTLGETTYPWRWLITIPVAASFLLLFLFAVIKIRGPNKENLKFLIFLFLVSLLLLIPLSEIHRNFSSRTFQLPSKIVFMLPILLLLTAKSLAILRLQLPRAAFALIILAGNAYGLTNYYTGKQFLNPKYLAPWRQMLKDIESVADPQDLVLTDEEGLLHEMRISGYQLEVYGLVGALEKIQQNLEGGGAFHVFGVIRYRGDEQITLETLNVKRELEALYPLVNTWNYVPTTPEVAPFWKRFLGREPPDYVVQVFVFAIDQTSVENP